MIEQLTTQTEDSTVAEIAERITKTFDETFDALIARRDAAYATAIVPLDAEHLELSREHQSIEQDAPNLEGLLESRARVSQYEADCLKLAGKHREAEAKLEEMKAAENAPRLMRERQREITARIEAIDAEKRTAAKRVFEQWYSECQTVHRAIERAHFIAFLDGLKRSFFDFEQRTDTYAKEVGQRGLFGVGHLANLSADEHSEEWASATRRWYAVRR
jgi:hypothetical protein